MCFSPIKVKNSNDIPVPCGKCPDCRARRVSGWSFRLMEEEKRSTSSYFLTLTYDTSNVPITQAGFMGLDKRDLQLFFKRLRKAHPGGERSLKYYAVGEYGRTTVRPHYHIILFNAKLEFIQPAWKLGEVHYGTVTGASIGYCLKYISKPHKIPMHRNDDRLSEFSLMSKGLGSNYINLKMQKWHSQDLENRMYLNLKDGKKISMPRYYKGKFYSDEERKAIAEKALLNNVEKTRRAYEKSDASTYRNEKAAQRAALERQYVNDKKGKI